MFELTRRQVLGVAGGGFLLALAGCSGDDSDSDQKLSDNRVGAMSDYKAGDQFKATEPLTFTVLYNNHPNYPIQKDWLFWSELEKRTGVKFQTTEVPLSDYNSKRSLILGSGDAPFIIPKTYRPDEEPFVASGTVLPVSDYLDLMPNFQDKINKWNLQSDMDSLRQADGKFYLLPGLHEDVWTDYTLAVRTDVLQKHNLQVPTTWEELRDTLKALKAAYPNSYPFSERFNQSPPTAPGGNLLNILGQAYGVNGGWNYQNATWDYNASKWVFTGAADGYKQMIEYLNTLVKEGLLDPESFTQSDDQARQKFASGKSFVISANAQSIVNDYRPDLAKVQGATVAKIPIPIGPMGPVRSGPGASRLENGVMISKKARDSKNFVAMMQFVDWLWYSDAGEEFARWGVEGVTYTKDGSGKRTLTPDVNMLDLNPQGTKHLQKDFGFYNGVFAYGGKTELLESFFSDEEREFQKAMNSRKTLPVPPPHPFTEEEREQATLLESPLKDFVTQQTVKFILGQRPLDQWDAYVSELKAKNMDQYMELITKAYDRFKKDHG
ncbi:ABC transporter substrate-binding protein [Rhizomonospora bruguierae]|uniref:ABC transporter substrate-binding protein n=1 Tax=Rhizomonospora bruguierae TaxID=1581705 RepID=UPI001BCDEA63|nr:extracellular solute-binding protein [Micromonospora sp. NBRC 107566]